METIYIVYDVKTTVDQTAVIITNTQHSSRNGAEQMYHLKLAGAANPDSQYPCHSVILATNTGFVIDTKCYMHDVTPPAPEPEPEEDEPTEDEPTEE